MTGPGVPVGYRETSLRIFVPAKQFSDTLYPLLSEHTIEEEHELIKNTGSVIRITHSFNDNQRSALERCVRIMAKGMADYQDAETLDGLENLAAMDDYCSESTALSSSTVSAIRQSK